MAYKVICSVQLAGYRATGNTRHYLGNTALPEPFSLQIAQYEGDSGFYLFYLNENDEEQTDTWHETLESAFRQAEWEFGVKELNWVFELE